MVVSTSCMLDVNRAVYRHLAIDYKVILHLVIPVRLKEVQTHGGISPFDNEPFSVTLLEMAGPHPRLERVKGLKALIQSWKPSHLVLDFDPATLLVSDAVQASRHLNASLSVLTCENQPRYFIREALKGVLSLQPKIMVGGVIAWWLLCSVRCKIQHVFTVCQDGTNVMGQLGLPGELQKFRWGLIRICFFHNRQIRLFLCVIV
jgi:hypothetical protein